MNIEQTGSPLTIEIELRTQASKELYRPIVEVASDFVVYQSAIFLRKCHSSDATLYTHSKLIFELQFETMH